MCIKYFSGHHVEVPLQQEVEKSPPVDVATTTTGQHGYVNLHYHIV